MSKINKKDALIILLLLAPLKLLFSGNSSSTFKNTVSQLTIRKNLYEAFENEYDISYKLELISKLKDVNSYFKSSYMDENFTPLMQACKAKDLTSTMQLLYRKAQVNLQNNHGFTALMYAACQNNQAVVSLLLQAKANIHLLNNKKESALMIAADYGNSDVVFQLIKSGSAIDLQNYFGQTALILAAKRKNLKTVQVLIKAGANINIKDNEGDTAFMKAIKWHKSYHEEDIIQNSFAVLNALIQAGADINTINNDKFTSLTIAAFNFDIELVKWLIQAGADVNFKMEGKTTLLKRLIRLGSDPILEKIIDILLQSGATISIKDLNQTLMDKSTHHIAKKLIQAGAPLNDEDSYGNIPLLIATGLSSRNIVYDLIDAGADVNIKHSQYLFTPLMIAAERGHKKIVKKLINAGADIEAKNIAGLTALIISAEKNHVPVVKTLLKAGAVLDINYNFQNKQIKEVFQCLNYFQENVEHGDPYLAHYIIREIEQQTASIFIYNTLYKKNLGKLAKSLSFSQINLEPQPQTIIHLLKKWHYNTLDITATDSILNNNYADYNSLETETYKIAKRGNFKLLGNIIYRWALIAHKLKNSKLLRDPKNPLPLEIISKIATYV